MDANSLERRFAFIDESGSPYFDPNRPEEGFVLVSTLIPESKLAAARLIVPRRADGELIKSSEQDATDELAAQFMERLFAETRAQIGIVTVSLSDAGNEDRMKRMKTGIDNSPFPRQSRPSITDAIRMQAALGAVDLSLMGQSADLFDPHIQIVFDRGSERAQFMRNVRDFMCSWRRGDSLVIDDVQWLSRHEEPLIMASDWIAGSVRHDIKFGDLPLARRILGWAKQKGRLHDREGFTAYLPSKSTHALGQRSE